MFSPYPAFCNRVVTSQMDRGRTFISRKALKYARPVHLSVKELQFLPGLLHHQQ